MAQWNLSVYRTKHDLTGFQRDLLYVIAGLDEPHGLAIKGELEDYYEKEIHHGRLCPNLDTLVEKGLVEKGEKDQRTNVYTLTRRGRREIEACRSEHRSRFYYDIDRLGRDFAMAMHDLAEEIHQYLVEFADAHSRCSCDERE